MKLLTYELQWKSHCVFCYKMLFECHLFCMFINSVLKYASKILNGLKGVDIEVKPVWFFPFSNWFDILFVNGGGHVLMYCLSLWVRGLVFREYLMSKAGISIYRIGSVSSFVLNAGLVIITFEWPQQPIIVQFIVYFYKINWPWVMWSQLRVV